MLLRPPRSTRTDTLFPYTTLFRSLPFARALEAAHALEANRPSLDDMTINESARRSAGKLIAAPQNRRGRTVELAHRPPSSRLTHLGRRWFRPAFRPGAASVAERPSKRRQGSRHQMPPLPRRPAALRKATTYATHGSANLRT